MCTVSDSHNSVTLERYIKQPPWQLPSSTLTWYIRTIQYINSLSLPGEYLFFKFHGIASYKETFDIEWCKSVFDVLLRIIQMEKWIDVWNWKKETMLQTT